MDELFILITVFGLMLTLCIMSIAIDISRIAKRVGKQTIQCRCKDCRWHDKGGLTLLLRIMAIVRTRLSLRISSVFFINHYLLECTRKI